MNWFSTNWQQDLAPIDQDVINELHFDPDLHLLPENNDTLFIMPESNLTVAYCRQVFDREIAEISTIHPEGYCNATSDTILCWPPTPFNETAVVKCFSELLGVKYDSTQNATRQCIFNESLGTGTWSKSNYEACTEIELPSRDDVITQATIYLVGYIISLVTLIVAIGIFTYFKELRCLRNTIHMNLMWSYMLTNCMWIITLLGLNFVSNTSVFCIFIVTLLHYFNVTNFFWMFVEGLYLYILVVETLTRESFKLRVYVTIGWGLPLLFIVIWGVVKNFVPYKSDPANSCIWFEKHDIDWIFQAPTVIVLLLNLVFLIAIMWVLITKLRLRSSNSVETQQYHKAAKALLVLMPLLGITYVVTLYAPTTDKASKNLFEFSRAVLYSTQGFTVALFYCFLNTEVQNTVRHHLETWKTIRSLGPRAQRSGSRSRDWSPRSRTESIRITEWTMVPMEDFDGADRTEGKHHSTASYSNGINGR